jgi:hypothetical protein
MRRRRLCGLAALAWLQGCSGGSAGPASALSGGPAAAAARQSCGLPLPGTVSVPAPVPPLDAIDVRRHGVRGDGHSPDGLALQRLLDQATPGQTLWFAPGVYLQDRVLTLRQTGVTLLGHGATLHATDPGRQALVVEGHDCRILGFTLTAVTDTRRMAPWESRIAVWRQHGSEAVRGVHIRDNRIIEHGPPGSAGANSSSSAAIYLERATGFVLTGNLVRRSLSDGIHITGGSRDGLVAGNLVRETGDDMIAVVSYLDADAATPLPAPAVLLAQLPARRERHLVRNVLITGNDLAGGYWGRGISVVGGEDIGIVDNTLDRCVHAAAIYLAREPGWRSFGVRNVRVAGNRISQVQTLPPAYSVLDEPDRSARTGHGAIELVAHLQAAEAGLPGLAEAFGIDAVLLQDNRVHGAATPGIRIGEGWGRVIDVPAGPGASGVQAVRGTAAPVRRVALQGNQVQATAGGIVVFNATDPQAGLQHADNRVDGQPWVPSSGQPLGAAAALATGSRLGCDFA